jgi:CRISPR-associated protein Csm1
MAAEERKCHKIDLRKHGGVIIDYFDCFNNELGICRYCGKQPAAKLMEESPICNICSDHILLGSNIVKPDKKIAIGTNDADFSHDQLSEPIFGQYQLAFVADNMSTLADKNKLLHLWNTAENDTWSQSENETKSQSYVTAKQLSGFIPKYTKDDLTDKNIERILAGNKAENLKNDLFDDLVPETPKTFHYLAKMALTDQMTGIEALGILKADVVGLGDMFMTGLNDNQSLSRAATLSRQMNNFFTVYLPFLLKNKYPDTYTLFAGGDDLFLIGPWRQIITLAGQLNDDFANYVCSNENITISAGVSINKPGVPIHILADVVEAALKDAKDSGRNRISLFKISVCWDIFRQLSKVKSDIENFLNEEGLNAAMIYRLNDLIEMAHQEHVIVHHRRTVSLEDMECFKWRSRLKYSMIRNAAKNLRGDERNQKINSMLTFFEDCLTKYRGACRIPLWQIIYERR